MVTQLSHQLLDNLDCCSVGCTAATWLAGSDDMLTMVLQLSYQLLDNLDEAFVGAMTGSDTNPETLAAALTAYSPSVYTDSSSFTSINTTIETLNTLNVSTCMMLAVLCIGSATICQDDCALLIASGQCNRAPESTFWVPDSVCDVLQHGESLTVLMNSI